MYNDNIFKLEDQIPGQVVILLEQRLSSLVFVIHLSYHQLRVKYTNNGTPGGRLINIGNADKSLLILVNISSQALSYVKTLAPFSNLKNDFAFSTNLGKK